MSRRESFRQSECLSAALQRIPGPKENALQVNTLCPSRVPGDSFCEGCIGSLLAVLTVFDVVSIEGDRGASRDLLVKARTNAALYFVRSLAAYGAKGLKLIADWQTRGVLRQVSSTVALESGPTFLYFMEQRRVINCGDDSPIRKERVSHAMIKTRVEGRRDPVFLVQYDQAARRFQLVGGKWEPPDSGPLSTMRRELSEELPLNKLVYGKDYNLRELAGGLLQRWFSPTYGAYSEGEFTVFLATFKNRRQLKLGPHDRWVSLHELLGRSTREGIRISGSYIQELDRRLPGGLIGLPLSLVELQRRR
jgi:8-oxo-dGTP pyrophosphatase MutT (NUDIX family)